MKMNKLIVDKEKMLENYEGQITYTLSESIITIKGKCQIIDIDNDTNLTIKMLDNSSLDYYKINNQKAPQNQNIILENNNEVNYYEIIINNEDSKYNLFSTINGNNNKLNLKLRVLNNTQNCEINANGKVLQNTHQNEMLEELKGLNIKNNQLTIKPNMQIDSLDVIANHNVTISNLNKDEIFYLASKGTPQKEIEKLLINGFLYSILPSNIKQEIEK